MSHLNMEKVSQALASGDIALAAELMKNAIVHGASAEEIYEWLTVLYRIYAWKDAKELAANLVEHPNTQTQQLLSAAKLFFQDGRFTTAFQLTRRANEIDQDNPDILAMLASCIERGNDKELAIPYLESALKLDPSHTRSVRLLAHIERRLSKFDQAKNRLQKHLQQYPSSDDWRLLYELAGVLDRLGLYVEASMALKLAKQHLRPQVPKHESRNLNKRQWQVTQLMTPERFSAWNTVVPSLEPKQKLCLMAGFPRSGTTLLENVLTSHPRCIGTDESGILQELYEKPLVLDADSATSAMEELDGFDAADLSAGRAEYLRCTEEYLEEVIDDRWLIDKEPLLTNFLAVPLRLFPDAKIIMPLRDPRDVVISYYHTMVPLADNNAAAIDLGESCKYYAQVMSHWLYWKKILPESQWMESRYEDLLSDPEKQTKMLAGFLEIEWTPAMLSHHKNRGDRNVSTPTYDDVSKPLYTRALARWKNYEAELEPHMRHLQPYLDVFGYSD